MALNKVQLIADLMVLMNLNNEYNSNLNKAVKQLAEAIDKFDKRLEICLANGGCFNQ